MRRPELPKKLAGLVLSLSALASCVHFNAVYNARSLFERVEARRLAGSDSALASDYAEVIVRAQRGLAAGENGSWSDDALLLIGRAHLRRGELVQARSAFRRARDVSADSQVVGAAELYLGAVAISQGDVEGGLSRLHDLASIRDRKIRAEGHLWRARALIRAGRSNEAFSDLELARAAHAAYGPPGDLQRVRWGISLGDTMMAFVGLQSLFRESAARGYGDSIRGELERVAELWGPAATVSLMRGAQDASWSRRERDQLLLLRGDLEREVGDTAMARRDMERVAGGAGRMAELGRLQLARWRLHEMGQLRELPSIRALLLPAVASTEARRVLNGIRRVEGLVDVGLEGERIAFFAAAEISRDLLGSPDLAAGLFLAYADGDHSDPWSAKAMLAAIELTADPASRRALDERLGGLPPSDYLRYARTGVTGPDLAVLEERLQSALDDVLGRVERDLIARRLLLPDTTEVEGMRPTR